MSSRVLVVEDDPSTMYLLTMILKRQGYEAILAEDATEAIRKICGEMPDLVIMDCILPQMNGLQICQFLRSSSMTTDIPVLMLSAMSRSAKLAAAPSSGVTEFMFKPFDLANLCFRVKDLLHKGSRPVPE